MNQNHVRIQADEPQVLKKPKVTSQLKSLLETQEEKMTVKVMKQHIESNKQ